MEKVQIAIRTSNSPLGRCVKCSNSCQQGMGAKKPWERTDFRKVKRQGKNFTNHRVGAGITRGAVWRKILTRNQDWSKASMFYSLSLVQVHLAANKASSLARCLVSKRKCQFLYWTLAPLEEVRGKCLFDNNLRSDNPVRKDLCLPPFLGNILRRTAAAQ